MPRTDFGMCMLTSMCGTSTTSAVVTVLFLLVVLDAVFAAFFNAVGL